MDWNLIYVVIAWAAGAGLFVGLAAWLIGKSAVAKEWIDERVHNRVLKWFANSVVEVAEGMVPELTAEVQSALANDGKIDDEEFGRLKELAIDRFKQIVGDKWGQMLEQFGLDDDGLAKRVIIGIANYLRGRLKGQPVQPGN